MNSRFANAEKWITAVNFPGPEKASSPTEGVFTVRSMPLANLDLLVHVALKGLRSPGS